MEGISKVCPFCGGVSKKQYTKMKGYVDGENFDIFVCDTCAVSSVDPLKTDEKVYEMSFALSLCSCSPADESSLCR